MNIPDILAKLAQGVVKADKFSMPRPANCDDVVCVSQHKAGTVHSHRVSPLAVPVMLAANIYVGKQQVR